MIREAVPRARPLLDDWMADAALLGSALARVGAVRAAPATVRRLLGRGEAVIVCPESNHPKPFRDRYRLGRFGRGAFARVAIATGTPVVPVAVIGAEEVHPVLARLDLPGRLLGLPTLPVTPTFPWLGLWGLVPLPTQWTLLFGEPPDVAARHASRDSATRCASGSRPSSSRAGGAGGRSSWADARRRRGRSGDHGHDRARVRPPGARRRARLLGVHAALPEAGVGRARRGGDLAGHAARAPPGVPARAGARARRGGARHHEPARDDAPLGPAERTAGASRHRVAGSAHRVPLRGAARARPRGRLPAEDRPRPRPVLLGHQAPLASGARAARRGARPRGRARLRHHRRLAHVEADRWRRARDRPDQRLA